MRALALGLLVRLDLRIQLRVENLEFGRVVIHLVMCEFVQKHTPRVAIWLKTVIAICPQAQADALAHILVQTEQIRVFVREELRKLAHLEAMQATNMEHRLITAELLESRKNKVMLRR